MHILFHRGSSREEKGFRTRFKLLIKSTLFARLVLNKVVDDGEIFISQSFGHHQSVDVMRERAQRNR